MKELNSIQPFEINKDIFFLLNLYLGSGDVMELLIVLRCVFHNNLKVTQAKKKS